MRAIQWPKNLQPNQHVCHAMNTGGTTWLKDSDLVFVQKRPYAILSWSNGVPDTYVELKPKLLHHDHGNSLDWRYDGEIDDPSSSRRPA